MDTKERRTSVQDTCPAPDSVCRTHNWRPAPPKAAKIELEKPKSISRGVRKNFLARFSLAKFGLAPHVARRGPAKGLRPRRAGASVGSSVRRAFFAMQNECRSLLVKKPGT